MLNFYRQQLTSALPPRGTQQQAAHALKGSRTARAASPAGMHMARTQRRLFPVKLHAVHQHAGASWRLCLQATNQLSLTAPPTGPNRQHVHKLVLLKPYPLTLTWPAPDVCLLGQRRELRGARAGQRVVHSGAGRGRRRLLRRGARARHPALPCAHAGPR